MTSGIRRREFIAGLGAGLGVGLFASPAIVRAEGPIVIRAGALKLIHSIAPYLVVNQPLATKAPKASRSLSAPAR